MLRDLVPDRAKAQVAEADGNRTRLPALAGTPVLKFGEGLCVPERCVTPRTGHFSDSC